MRGTVRPLTGVKVLGLPGPRAAPLTHRILTDLGADVVVVGQAGAHGRAACRAGTACRFREGHGGAARSVGLDLASPAGQDIAARLACAAGVVLGYAGADAHGLGWVSLAARNPRLVYCSMGAPPPSGPGAGGLVRTRLGFGTDAIVHAMSGVLCFMPGLPTCRGCARASQGEFATALYEVLAIIAAVHERDASDRGSRVRLRPFDSLFSVLAASAAAQLAREPATLGTVPAASAGSPARVFLDLLGSARLDGAPVRQPAGRRPVTRPGPRRWHATRAVTATLLGQHTDEVIEDWLRCGLADIERLRCEGAFG